jgi:hypothetical protein
LYCRRYALRVMCFRIPHADNEPRPNEVICKPVERTYSYRAFGSSDLGNSSGCFSLLSYFSHFIFKTAPQLRPFYLRLHFNRPSVIYYVSHKYPCLLSVLCILVTLLMYEVCKGKVITPLYSRKVI